MWPSDAEVLLAAPVVGDDVAGAGVLGADDLEVVRARLGGAHPRLHRGPAAAVHLVARLLQRPGHEARAPRVAGADVGRREVLVDVGAGVGARPPCTPCASSFLATSRADAPRPLEPDAVAVAASATAAGARAGGRQRARGAGRRLHGHERAGVELLRARPGLGGVLGGDGLERARVAGLGLRLRGGGRGDRRPGRGSGRGRGGGRRGGLEAGGRFAVEGDVEVVLVGAVGEEALGADLATACRPRSGAGRRSCSRSRWPARARRGCRG